MRANLTRDSLITEKAALAVRDGYAQLQRHIFAGKGDPVVEPLSAWTPVAMIKPGIGMLSFHVKAANAYAAEGDEANTVAAMKRARGCFQ